MIKKWFVKCIVLIAGLIFLFCSKKICIASEEDRKLSDCYYDTFYESMNFEELKKELEHLNKNYGKNSAFDFEGLFHLLMEGNVDEAVRQAFLHFCNSITLEIRNNSDILVKLLFLVIVAAIFNTYSSVYKFSFIGEQGFFVTYIMIALLLLQSFGFVYNLSQETIQYIGDLLKCMLPAFYMSVMLCSGITTSHMVNTMFVWMLTVLEKLLFVVILPGTQVYFLIVLLNQISSVDRFSKLAALIKQGLKFTLNLFVTGLFGINVMKSLLVPVYDNAKYNILQKGLSVVPGGSSLTGLSTILLGAGLLIKNSVGIAIAMMMIVLGSIPLLEILCFYAVYKVILALVQPISDERILKGIQGAADSTGILLRATTTSVVLALLSIAIVIVTTNVKLYTG